MSDPAAPPPVLKLWLVHVSISTDVYVVAPTQEAASRIVETDPDILDELRDLDPLCFARPLKGAIPESYADSLPYGAPHASPSRDWTLAQWEAHIRG